MGGTGFQDTVLHTAPCNYSHIQVPGPATSIFTWVASGTRKLFWGLIKCSVYVTSEENAQCNILKDISLGDADGKLSTTNFPSQPPKGDQPTIRFTAMGHRPFLQTPQC